MLDSAIHLGYHYVRNADAPGPNCTPARLRATIEYLKTEGYEFMTCGQVAWSFKIGAPLPEKHATLSFDDGLFDHWATTFPILQEYGVPATFFYITCVLEGRMPPVIGFQILIALLGAERLEREILPRVFAGTPYLDLLDPKRYDMTDRRVGELPQFRRIKRMFNDFVPHSLKGEKIDEMFAEYVGEGSQERYVREWFMVPYHLRDLVRAGMEIASHTVSHPLFSNIGMGEIRHEVTQPYVALQQLLHRPVTTFGYAFDGAVRPPGQQLLAGQYHSAWSFCNGYEERMKDPYQNLFDIPRLHEAFFKF